MSTRKPESLALTISLVGTLIVLSVFMADLVVARHRDLEAGERRLQHFGLMMAEHTARTFEAVDVLLRETATDLSHSRRDWIKEADRFIAAANLADKHATAAMALPHGDKRKLEVAIMMALEPHVFMFDEPTAGMSVDDVPVILDLIKRLKSKGDKTILLVEHKMEVVKSLADRIVVLHNGRLVADGEPAEVIGSAVVQEAYLGIAAGRRRAGGEAPRG